MITSAQVSSLRTLIPDNWRPLDSTSIDAKSQYLYKEPLRLSDAADILNLLSNKNSAAVTLSDNSHVTLCEPDDFSKNMSPEVKARLIEMINNKQNSHDIDVGEKLVEAVATLFGSQVNAGAPLNRPHPTQKSDAVESMPPAASSQGRTFPAIEGGTDITDPSASSFNFVNVMGDAKLVTALIAVLTVLNRQEAMANTLSAKWSKNIFNSAEMVGNKSIAAAEERRTGAIVSGVTALGLTGASTVRTCNALKKESNSINNNMREANRIDRHLSGGEKINDPQALAERRDFLRTQHDLVGKKSSSVLQQAEMFKQSGGMLKETLYADYEVHAAGKTKQAELARAEQTMSGDVGNVHSQTGRKASEGETSLRQSMTGILSSNNDAIAAIARRMG